MSATGTDPSSNHIRVFVTDAEYKHALGAIRALGTRGFRVTAGSHDPKAQGFYSRYCARRVIYPNPAQYSSFVEFLKRELETHPVDVLLPIGYYSNVACSRSLTELNALTRIPVAPWRAMEIASNKTKTLTLAKSLGIHVPEDYPEPDRVRRFPAVMKASLASGQLRYARSPLELRQLYRDGMILQDYVPGDGYGFFALYRRGNAMAIFMHRRRREFPVTGGPSTSAESVLVPELRQVGLKLLDALKWHGAAMVEFKKDARDGVFRLMEVNPKFWGSLDLAIASGVDFPYLATKLALSEDFDPVFEYQTGLRFQWLLPDDIMHVLAAPKSFGALVRDYLDERTRSNVWFRDVRPNLRQAAMTLGMVLASLRDDSRLYPHGKPT